MSVKNKITAVENPLEKLKSQKKLRSQLTMVGVGALYIYMVVATGEALWQNYRVNSDIAKLRAEIIELQDKGVQLRNLIAYRGTESFKEREARRKLGYKKPGEQVLAIPQPYSPDVESGQAKETTEEETRAKLNNFQKWIDYIFG
ncbi:hypothetical protein A2V68_01005 [candidate division Kazan bacterium RBG_13_50_9]|uniref:Cell division protein FtsL n=1 Tax=candidate division Kazan bacterium RBG_13_50_9 TaxID=1798535 RepID=A0A1F4NSP3_UNCK3|nr:MAG: hypothetical protein A2V68_01005 [candidate division Kazan bacterium RBG_13_50_9]